MESGVHNQIDRGIIPATVIARKRRVGSDVMDAMIEVWLDEAIPTHQHKTIRPSAAEFLIAQGVKFDEITDHGGGEVTSQK